MRRPVLYLAGLLVATGASLALAGPASAAVSHDRHNCHHNSHSSDWYDDDEYNINHEDNDFNGNEQNGIFLLSGIGGIFGGF